MDDKRFRSDKERNPIAELARLMAQGDSHEESAPSDNRLREETISDSHDEMSELPPAPQLAIDLNEHDRACEHDEHCSDDQAYDVGDELYATEEECQASEVPRLRRRGLSLVMAIFGLALVGSACAVGYRNMVGGLVSPTLLPTTAINERNRISEAPTESIGNARQIGPATTGSIDNMVSRQEQPTTIGPAKAAPHGSLPRARAPATPAAGQAVPIQALGRVAGAADPPASLLTTPSAPQRSRQRDGTGVTAASVDERPAAAPVAHADANSRAAVTAPTLADGYAVQVASERSEVKAQAAFRALQAKYPNQLSSHQPVFRRADLGAAGIYYRALVGPFASAQKAAKVCSGIKAAGGDCIIQKN